MRVEKTKGQPATGIQETLQVIDDFYHFSFAGVRKNRESEDEVELVSGLRNRQTPNPIRVVLEVIAIVENEVGFRSRLLPGCYSIAGDIETPVPVMVNGGIRMVQYISNVPSKIEDVFTSPYRFSQLRIEVRKLLNVLRDKRHVILSVNSLEKGKLLISGTPTLRQVAQGV
jgi:hypothetical protein